MHIKVNRSDIKMCNKDLTLKQKNLAIDSNEAVFLLDVMVTIKGTFTTGFTTIFTGYILGTKKPISL